MRDGRRWTDVIRAGIVVGLRGHAAVCRSVALWCAAPAELPAKPSCPTSLSHLSRTRGLSTGVCGRRQQSGRHSDQKSDQTDTPAAATCSWAAALVILVHKFRREVVNRSPTPTPDPHPAHPFHQPIGRPPTPSHLRTKPVLPPSPPSLPVVVAASRPSQAGVI